MFSINSPDCTITEYIRLNNIGLEDENNEFKLICLSNIDLFYTEDCIKLFFFKILNINRSKYINKFFKLRDIEKFLLNDIIIDWKLFNEMMYGNIIDYILKYSKYAAIFSKAGIEGTLKYGINDDGTIEGIPFYGNINYEYLLNIFNKSKELLRAKSENKNYLDEYFSKIKFNIIKLGENEIIKHKDEIKTSYRTLNDMIEYNNKLKREWIKYEKDNRKWHNELFEYSGKLMSYLTNIKIRLRLREFIKKEFIRDKILERNKISYILNSIDMILENDEYIDFQKAVLDKYNIFYWIAKFKDINVREIKKNKPKHPMYRPMNNLFLHFSNNVRNINPLLKYDKNINFYIIEIKYPKINESINGFDYLEYKTINGTKWISKKRIMTIDGPSCI
jgi:hypothetical protein